MDAACTLYLWGTSFTFLAIVCGVWTWNIFSPGLPVALVAGLIISETAFGLIGCLVVHGRWPNIMETTGVAVMIAGVVLATPVFHS
ncbi:hypothetical protein CO660_19950 [Rhizobium sp. L9]|nr:hypothetical protein CO660_19950 [Rhizobium sp. L9]